MQPAKGIRRWLEVQKSGPLGSIQAAAKGESSGRASNADPRLLVEPAGGAGNIQDIVEHLTARLAEQGMVRAALT